MTRKAFKKSYHETDRFDRKQKKHSSIKEKKSKQRYSIYDKYSDEEDYEYRRNLDIEQEDDE